MALISCPECNREKVSDSAKSCPDCGFGIYKWVNMEEIEDLEEDIEWIEKEIGWSKSRLNSAYGMLEYYTSGNSLYKAIEDLNKAREREEKDYNNLARDKRGYVTLKLIEKHSWTLEHNARLTRYAEDKVKQFAIDAENEQKKIKELKKEIEEHEKKLEIKKRQLNKLEKGAD